MEETRHKIQFNKDEQHVFIKLNEINYVEFITDFSPKLKEKNMELMFVINSKRYYVRPFIKPNILIYKIYFIQQNEEYKVVLYSCIKEIFAGFTSVIQLMPTIIEFNVPDINIIHDPYKAVTNLKLIMKKKIYDKYFYDIKISSVKNIYQCLYQSFKINEERSLIFYTLSKHDINTIKCYNIIGKYICIDLIYLSYIDLKKTDIIAKITTSFLFAEQKNKIQLYYEDIFKLDEKDTQVLHAINKKKMSVLYKNIKTYDLKYDLKIITDLSDIFCHISSFLFAPQRKRRLIYFPTKQEKCISLIPREVLKIIDSYLEKDRYYCYLISKIYKSIKTEYKFGKVTFVMLDKISYFNDKMYLL